MFAWMTSCCLTYITSEFDSLASGDGQLLLNVEELSERVSEMEPDETQKALADILTEIQGKAGEVYFYAR